MKKMSLLFISVVISMTFLFLLATPINAMQYFVTYSGCGFQPETSSFASWQKYSTSGELKITEEGKFFCPVNLHHSDTYVKCMTIDLHDTSSFGYLEVDLMRMHIPSGTVQTVASFSSNNHMSLNRIRVHVATNSGTKYIDTAYFAYFLVVSAKTHAYIDHSIILYSVRILYGD
jgi:hypothetical protein